MSTHPSHPSVNLCHLFSTQMCKFCESLRCAIIFPTDQSELKMYDLFKIVIAAIHRALSVWAFWMKRRVGVQLSQSNKCCWGSKTCWIHPTQLVQLNQRRTIFSSTIKLSTNDEWGLRQKRILLPRKMKIVLFVEKWFVFQGGHINGVTLQQASKWKEPLCNDLHWR